MELRMILTTRRVALLVCLCAFLFSQFPHHAVHALAASFEIECPLQEDGKRSEEEVADRSLTRRRSNDRSTCAISRPRNFFINLRQTTPRGIRTVPIIGHQFSNGPNLPLLI